MKTYSKLDLIKMLKSASLRITDHRMAILVYLSQVKIPVTVYELIELLRKKEDIDQATVYRNLAALQRVGLLRRLDFNHGHAHYELETGQASHQLVCSNCETIEKIKGIPIESIVKSMLKKSKKFKNMSASGMEVYGLCKDCSRL